jgi:hypothetical protein
MTRARLLATLATAIATLGISAISAQAQAARLRTCFYYANSGWGLWATPNVRCSTAKRIYRKATRKCGAYCNGVYQIHHFRCYLNFDGGGDGRCTASHHRRIKFSVP